MTDVSPSALADLIHRRRSRRAFSSRPVEPQILKSLLEAARWAASASNEQPWRYIIADKGQPQAHARLAATLVPGNRLWAEAAPVLVLAVAKRVSAGGSDNRHALHDLGQASAQMALQATAHGLIVHQMAGFDGDAARTAFQIPEAYDPVTVIAIGYPGSPEQLDTELRTRECATPQRKPLGDIAFAGDWDVPAFSGE